MPPRSWNGGGPAAAWGLPLTDASGLAGGAPLAAPDPEAAAAAPLVGGPDGWLAKNALTSWAVLPGANLAISIWCAWGPSLVTLMMVIPAGRLAGMS